MVQAQNTMRRIGLDLINEKLRAIGRLPIEVETVGTTEEDKGSAHLPQHEFDSAEPLDTSSRDLLSVLSKFIQQFTCRSLPI